MVRGRVVITVFVVFLTLTMTGYGVAFRSDIVGAWSMDEGSGKIVKDISGKGNNGEIKGTANWSDGQFGKALAFDGKTGYVEIPFSESMRVLNKGDVTLAAWFKINAVPTEFKVIFQQADKNGTGRIWLYVVANTGEFRSFLGGAEVPSGFNIAAGEWYHGAVVVTEGGANDSVQIYINGEPSGAPAQKAMEDSEGNYLIGCRKSLNYFWDGIIDDVVLIKKALDKNELQDLMKNGFSSILSVESLDKMAVSWGNIKK